VITVSVSRDIDTHTLQIILPRACEFFEMGAGLLEGKGGAMRLPPVRRVNPIMARGLGGRWLRMP
jgi:hypothetical protein